MTNEDIEKIIIQHYGTPLSGMMPVARALILQAYEEAAQIADQLCREADQWEGGDPEIAIRIRALKDSLSETVPTGE